jgi:hypothetical protein
VAGAVMPVSRGGGLGPCEILTMKRARWRRVCLPALLLVSAAGDGAGAGERRD